MNCIQKSITAAGGAAVMTDLQNLGAQVIAMPSQQPVLLRALGIPHKQKAHHSVTHERDGARKIWILETDGPGRIGCEKGHRQTIDPDGITGMNAMPLDMFALRRRERSNVSVRSAGKRRVPVVVRSHCPEHTGRSTHMVGVWMGQHEGF